MSENEKSPNPKLEPKPESGAAAERRPGPETKPKSQQGSGKEATGAGAGGKETSHPAAQQAPQESAKATSEKATGVPSKPTLAAQSDSVQENVKSKGRGGILFVVAVLLMLLAGAGGSLAYLLRQKSSTGSADHAQIVALSQQIESLKSRITELATRRPPQSPLAQVGVETKVPDQILARLDAQDQKTTKLGAQIVTQEQKIASLATAVLADHAAVEQMQSSVGDLPKLAAQAIRMAQIQAAILALQSGAPLGTIPNAPEAVVRYATAAPPTEAGLRAEFEQYAAKAEAAGGKVDVGATGGIWARIRAHVISLVTIRRGDKVLVGSRADAVLSDARADLAAQNLAGAVQTLKSLPPASQDAMLPWMRKAENLLAARAALLKLAEQG